MVIITILLALAGIGAGFGANTVLTKKKIGSAADQADKELTKAKKEAQKLIDEARKQTLDITEEARKEETTRRPAVNVIEQRRIMREEGGV